MRRTFTLRQVLVVITLVAVACGVATNLPNESMLVGMTLTYFLPGIFLGGLFSLASARQHRALAMVLIGAVCCFATGPGNVSIWGNYNLVDWDLYSRSYLPVAAFPTLGAVVGGVTAIILYPRSFHSIGRST
jgi:hypothetical protein